MKRRSREPTGWFFHLPEGTEANGAIPTPVTPHSTTPSAFGVHPSPGGEFASAWVCMMRWKALSLVAQIMTDAALPNRHPGVRLAGVRQ